MAAAGRRGRDAVKTIFAGGAGIRWAAAASLAGHALAVAVIGLDAGPAPPDPPPVTVELAFVDEPDASAKIPARPPPDAAREESPLPGGTAAPAAPGARAARVDVRERKDRAAARPPKPRREARPPRTKPPPPPGPSAPPVRPAPRAAVTVEEARPTADADSAATDAPPRKAADTGRRRPPEDSRFAVDALRRDRPDAAAGAPPRAADARRPAGTPAGVTRGVRVAAGNRPPGYPFAARRRGLEGRVLLRVEVSRTGTAEQVTITRSSGHGLLDDAARRAVAGWRFLPATVAGAAVSGAVDVPVSFRLRQPAPPSRPSKRPITQAASSPPSPRSTNVR